jgi:DNA-binding transcriptional LysR family regulator
MEVVKFQQKLTVRHLRLISVLGRELSIGRCADVLHTSQSAVSRGLAEIEALLGAILFERTTRRFLPTALGQNLIWHAEQVLNQLDKAESEFNAITRGEGGTLNIGIIGAFSPRILAQATRLARCAMPKLRIRLHSNFADGLVVDLMRGRCDLLLTHLDVRQFGEDLVADVLYEEHIEVLASVRHPLARRKRLTWRDLSDDSWALTPVQTSTRRTVERNLRINADQQNPVIVETMELHHIIELVQNSGFLTAMSSHLANWFEDALGDVKKLPVIGDNVPLVMCVARLNSRKLSDLERLFVDSLKSASAVPS